MDGGAAWLMAYDFFFCSLFSCLCSYAPVLGGAARLLLDVAWRREDPERCMAWSFWRMMVFLGEWWVGVCIERERGDDERGV